MNGIILNKPKNLFEIFTQLNIFIVNISNEISGGLTLVNFDTELSDLILDLNITLPTYMELFNNINMMFQQLNFANSRYGNQSPYVTLTIGIVDNEIAALICKVIFNVMLKGSSNNLPFIFPNVIFRIKQGINKYPNDKFYSLYDLALHTTSKQMNPTYILADSEMNSHIDPLHLHITGCRSRLLKTRANDPVGIGRANIGAVSINIPRIAMITGNLSNFYELLEKAMNTAGGMLIKKQKILEDMKLKNSPIIISNNILYPFDQNINSILEEASLAIGFIGMSEASEVLLPKGNLQDRHILINDILQKMFDYCNFLSEKHNKIITLLGASGEHISYYFLQNDKVTNVMDKFMSIQQKGYYTNSFHVLVNELVDPVEKLYLEGKHHKFCNGGGISYIEICHNQNNIKGFDDIIKIAEKNNVNYLGFNFQKNVCADCGSNVIGEICENCHGKNIIKLRRVSGYLGYLNSFSTGKKLEERLRIKHTNIIRDI